VSNKRITDKRRESTPVSPKPNAIWFGESEHDASDYKTEDPHWSKPMDCVGGRSRPPTVEFVRVSEYARIPTKATEGAAGFDLYSIEDVRIPSEWSVIIDTGWLISVPEGFEAQVRPRSGLAFSQGVTVLNSPGTIDSDYRGPLKVVLVNHSPRSDDDVDTWGPRSDVHIKKGDRIAQLVVARVPQVRLEEVAVFSSSTTRGTGGFGSTGR
jgi:dUTP pyrophosphatase